MTNKVYFLFIASVCLVDILAFIYLSKFKLQKTTNQLITL